MKRFILYGIMLFLFLPLLQKVFRFNISANSTRLAGAFTTPKDTALTINTWFSGEFQTKKQDLFTQASFPFHNLYVRLNNQIDFSLFNISNAEKTIVGKKGFFFESQYIDAYYGNDFSGEKVLTDRFGKLKRLQQLLGNEGVLLEVVFAPSKASFYEEYIPDHLKSKKKVSNYDYSVALCRRMGIDHIDFNAWFLAQKDAMKYNLYPQTGIHWSNYGSLIATDSLIKHIIHQTGINYKNVVIDTVSFSQRLRHPDQDLAAISNLLITPRHLSMPYASFQYTNGEKPKMMFIGDSYFWNISTQKLPDSLFTDWSFWYYNKTMYPANKPVPEVILPDIKKYKVVVLMATGSNLSEFGWGFIEKAYEEAVRIDR